MQIKQEIKDYWHKRSKAYDKWHLARSEEEKLAYKKVLGKVLGNGNLNILDVGCGTGFVALLLAEMGHEVAALDITEGMMEKAKTHARESGLSIRFEIGDADNLPFDDESFDTVVCRWLFWTLPDHLRAMKEWVRVTRHGGKILVIDGKWRDLSSLTGLLKEICRGLGTIVYEKKFPWNYGYRKEVNSLLPTRDGVTSDDAVRIFQQAGLSNISLEMLNEIRAIQFRTAPLLYKPAYFHPTFLIKGERRNEG